MDAAQLGSSLQYPVCPMVEFNETEEEYFAELRARIEEDEHEAALQE